MISRQVLGFLAAVVLAVSSPLVAATRQETAASGVLHRLLGERSNGFVLKEIPREKGGDVFEVESHGGKVYVSGSTGVAICRGAYEYLKNACDCIVSWEGSHIDLPSTLPEYPRTRVACPYQYRHYFNVCTFGYTMVWWDWKRWEREIDWMALHGINMPLAMNGQEAIWQKVWKSYGLGDEDLKDFFSGPAFLPWHRMGNINGHAGPLPQGWIDGQLSLQKQILARERELGMTPVTPAFSGFVPPALAKKRPEVSIRKSSGWAGFEPTLLLDPKDPMFVEIGRKFIEEYRKEFGTDHLYLSDTFNEMTPQLDPKTKLDYLASVGESVYRSVAAGDPDGTWVMMGWLFLDGGFWDEPAKKALFSRVPVERMVLLDLAVDLYAISSDSQEFRNRQWIFSFLTNFGQNTTTGGVLKYYADSPIKALRNPDRGRLIGMGLTPEGIEHDAIDYELITDMMWREKPVRLKSWVRDYCRDRYGACPPEMEQAWDILSQTLYNINFSRRPVYAMRPGPGLRGPTAPYDPAKVKQAISLFLSCADKLGGSSLYRRDLVDIVRQYVADGASGLIPPITVAYVDGDKEALKKASAQYLTVVGDIDRLLATRPEYHLSQWIGAARKWGKSSKEKDFYEQNARMQLTVWGGPELYDYAYKDWTGLITDFYIPRWQRLLDALAGSDSGKPFDPKWKMSIADWELGWTRSTKPPKEARQGDSVAIARELFTKYGDWPERWTQKAEPGIAVGKPVTVSGGTEGDHAPERAVDGNSDDWDASSWWASPAPQWIQIDLQKQVKIDRVQVYTYWDWTRSYRYTVEISADAKTWTQVADMSRNTRPATSRGDIHKFAPTEARYVRVNVLGNSADGGVHLVEARVFDAKP